MGVADYPRLLSPSINHAGSDMTNDWITDQEKSRGGIYWYIFNTGRDKSFLNFLIYVVSHLKE